MMTFLAPVFLALAALALPILVFYMLRLRRREVLVSSIMLWRQVLRDREANTPWQRLRRSLLLLLQLLLLALLVLALARPALSVRTLIQGNVVVLLDASASMAAVQDGTTRFAVAKDHARRLAGELAQGATMTLIAVEHLPRVLVADTSDPVALRRALDGAEVSLAEADWLAAWSLAAAALGPAAGASGTTLVVISDGGLPPTLTTLPVPIRYLPVDGASDNRAISALAVRDGAHGTQAFVQLENYGRTAATPLLELYASGVLFDARRVSLPGAASEALSWDSVPDGFSWLEARLVHDDGDPPDLLAADDRAWTVRAPRSAGRVLLVTPGNLFLERAVASLPGLEAYVAPPEDSTSETSGPAGSFDLTIYDGILPDAWPEGSLLIVNPPHSTDLFAVTGVCSDTTVVRTAVDDPVLHHVDLGELHVARARRIEAFGGARSLVEAEGGALLIAGETGGRRLAILAFDLHDSDLPLQIAFPLLVSNLAGWLLPQQPMAVPAALSPGDPLVLHPAPEAQSVVIETPLGEVHELGLSGEEPTFAGTTSPGLYAVHQELPGAGRESALVAVNLFSSAESDLVPKETVLVGGEPLVAAPQRQEGQRELWAFVALVACLVLVTEWWVYWRGSA
jgi:hypothetical protein